jgi:hypothetical protein
MQRPDSRRERLRAPLLLSHNNGHGNGHYAALLASRWRNTPMVTMPLSQPTTPTATVTLFRSTGAMPRRPL